MYLLDIIPNLPDWALYLIIGAIVGVLFIIWMKTRGPGGVMGARTELNLYALDEHKYKVLRSFRYAVDNKIATCNYVILSVYGIFMCDYVNCNGLVKGNDTDPEWVNIVKNDYGAKSQQMIPNAYVKIEETCELLKRDPLFADKTLIPTVIFGEYLDLDMEGDKLKVRINNVEKDLSIFKKEKMTEETMNSMYNELKGDIDTEYKN